jgi:hypothetical protein
MSDPDRFTAEGPDAPRPWEQPGVVRRDCEPHRGDYLAVLGTVSIVMSLAGSLLSLLIVLIGIGLGVAVVVMAGHDLEKMRTGAMDSGGEGLVKTARRRGLWAIALGLLVVVLCVGLVVALNVLLNRR